MSPANILDQYVNAQLELYTPASEPSTIIFYRAAEAVNRISISRKMGLLLMVLAIGGLAAAIWPFLSLEINYAIRALPEKIAALMPKTQDSPPPINNLSNPPSPELNPLIDPSGNPIEPANKDFAIVIPSIGVNAPVVPGVNQVETAGYNEALKKGVAHSSTSYYPNENGTVYLFSHSTNYEWFVKDLNAVFYMIKNLKEGDLVVVMYMGDRYTYKIRETKVVSRREVAYLKPQTGVRNLILQTCWPPGTNSKRMLIFADFVEVKHYGNFQEELNRPTQFGTLMRLATIR